MAQTCARSYTLERKLSCFLSFYRAQESKSAKPGLHALARPVVDQTNPSPLRQSHLWLARVRGQVQISGNLCTIGKR